MVGPWAKEKPVWRTVRLIGGLLLIGLGLLFMLLPVLPGLPLIIAGAAVLGFDHPLVSPWVTGLRRWRGSRGADPAGRARRH